MDGSHNLCLLSIKKFRGLEVSKILVRSLSLSHIQIQQECLDEEQHNCLKKWGKGLRVVFFFPKSYHSLNSDKIKCSAHPTIIALRSRLVFYLQPNTALRLKLCFQDIMDSFKPFFFFCCKRVL